MSNTLAHNDSALELNEDPRVLVRKFFWCGLLCLVILLVLTSYGIYRIYSWRLLESTHAEAKAACQVILVKEKKHLLEIDKSGQTRLNLPASEQAGFAKRLRSYFQPFAVDSIRIWNLQKQLVNRTDCQKGISPPPDSDALAKALAGDDTSLLTKNPNSSEFGNHFWDSAAQVVTYLPVWGRNKEVLGAIEIRQSVDNYQAEIHSGIAGFIFLLGAALLTLFGCVFLLVRTGAERLARAQHILHSLATTDPLTGLYNRREVLTRAEKDFATRQQKSAHHQEPVNFGLLMLDVDDFKDVNDTYGHAVGDRVLQELAQRIRTVLRPYDVLGRIGGEEFLVVLPDSSLEQCQEIAERLCRTVREKPFAIDGLRIFGSISIGGATAYPLDRDLKALLQRADERLYRAKNLGKNRVFWAEEALCGGEVSGGA